MAYGVRGRPWLRPDLFLAGWAVILSTLRHSAKKYTGRVYLPCVLGMWPTANPVSTFPPGQFHIFCPMGGLGTEGDTPVLLYPAGLLPDTPSEEMASTESTFMVTPIRLSFNWSL